MKIAVVVKSCFIIFIAFSLISSVCICTQPYVNAHIRNPHQVGTIQPSPENVYNDIDVISVWYRYLDTPGHRNAEDYIFSKFSSFGLNTTRQEYTCHRRDGDVRGANVLGQIDGVVVPEQWLVIGGHYDANKYSTHAAYDNAAGAAAVIELARVFAEFYGNSEGPSMSMVFATWDAEEGGGAGSKYFVDNLPDGVSVSACINLDMYSLNYPVRNSIPGSSEEYFKLNLYTSPVSDFSGYDTIDFNESTVENFTIFQNLLEDIAYEKNDLPKEWVIVQDDTALVSDHAHFVRESIPAAWFRGMNEYPKDEFDLNERNFKHTPADTLEVMEQYAGGKAELLKGIDTGLILAYQLALGVLNLTSQSQSPPVDEQDNAANGIISGVNLSILMIVAVCIFIVFIFIYVYRSRYYTRSN